MPKGLINKIIYYTYSKEGHLLKDHYRNISAKVIEPNRIELKEDPNKNKYNNEFIKAI